MANLKDLIVNGVSRVIGKVYSNGGFVGDLEGTATKATKDGSGNTIVDTYATKTELTNGLGTKQNTLTAQTAYSSKGSATKVPQITTNALGQVTSITEVTITQPGATSTSPKMDGTAAVGTETTFARGDHVHPTDTSRASSTHTHGNITNGGALQTNDVTIANGDKIVVTDSSDSGKVARTSIAFDGSTATQALTKKGTWETFLTSHQDISGKENSSNKVSSWSATTSDTKYPSEKLVKDSLDGKASASHTHSRDDLVPIAEKTYTGLLASSNTNGSGADFIMIDLAHDADTSKIFKLRLRIEAKYTRTDDRVTYTSEHDCLIYGCGGNGTICSAMWNNHRNSSYRPLYYLVAYRPSTATANWKVGICLYSCNNNTVAGNERTVTMKVISQENCTASLYDTCANTDYATYYKSMAGRTTWDCANNGLRESGDDNTTTNVYAKDVTGYCGTGAGTQQKSVDYGQFTYTGTKVFKFYLGNANSYNGKITMTVNGQGAKDVYLLTANNTWTITGTSNKTMAAGSWWGLYDSKANNIKCLGTLNSSSIPIDVAYVSGQASYSTKNVFVNGIGELISGQRFRMRVDTASMATSAHSLNVNNLGAKPLFVNNATTQATALAAGWYEVVYDGTNYNAVGNSGGVLKVPAAVSADKDGSGNSITSTYATKTALEGKQNSLASQTAYTSKGSATKVPQITTNSLGQVTGITEVTITNTEYAVPDATTLASITNDLT